MQARAAQGDPREGEPKGPQGYPRLHRAAQRRPQGRGDPIGVAAKPQNSEAHGNNGKHKEARRGGNGNPKEPRGDLLTPRLAHEDPGKPMAAEGGGGAQRIQKKPMEPRENESPGKPNKTEGNLGAPMEAYGRPVTPTKEKGHQQRSWGAKEDQAIGRG